jgi:hypothetical protein
MEENEINQKAREYEAIALVEEFKKNNTSAGWSEEQEKILKIWAEKAAGSRWLHEHSARHYRRLNNRFVYPQIILSTLAGVGGFGVSTSRADTGNIAIAGYTIAAINICSALLSSFQKFICSAEKSENHTTIGRQFAAFYRTIILELSLNPRDRTDCLDLCRQCRVEYDRLMNVAPSVPQKIINLFKERFPDAKYKPDIANGLSDLQLWDNKEADKVDDAVAMMREYFREMYAVENISIVI